MFSWYEWDMLFNLPDQSTYTTSSLPVPNYQTVVVLLRETPSNNETAGTFTITSSVIFL